MLTLLLDLMLSGFQLPMTHSTLPLGDMVLRQCLRLTHIITRSTLPMRRLSEQATSTLKSSHRPYSKIVTHPRNSLKRRLLSSRSMWLTRRIWTDQDRHSSIIAPDTSWTRLFGTALAGQLSQTLTLIRIELNTENSSTSRNHSTTELFGRVQASCDTRTWLMSQETCGSLVSEVINWITRNLRRLEEETRTVSPFILITLKNEIVNPV